MDLRIIGKFALMHQPSSCRNYTTLAEHHNYNCWISADFGLSNEQYTQGENGMIHCSTQCGSPAYAAPELLGHKQYGPEVDIWSM